MYDLEGRYLAEAICREAKGFGDTTASREQGRLYKKVVKSAQQQAEALELLEQHELAALAPKVDVPEPIEKRVKEVLIEEEVIHQNLRLKVQRKVEIEEAEEISEFDQAFMRTVALMKKAK